MLVFLPASPELLHGDAGLEDTTVWRETAWTDSQDDQEAAVRISALLGNKHQSNPVKS